MNKKFLAILIVVGIITSVIVIFYKENIYKFNGLRVNVKIMNITDNKDGKYKYSYESMIVNYDISSKNIKYAIKDNSKNPMGIKVTFKSNNKYEKGDIVSMILYKSVSYPPYKSETKK